jgi:hypothetical protein
MLLLLLACATTDKLVEDSDTAGTTATSGELQFSFDAAIQRSDWGGSLGRCSVKVTFTRRPENDGMGEGPGQLWDPLNTPQSDGECAVTIRDPVAMQEALDAQDPPPDNWILVGTVEVGSVVQLVSEKRTVDLLPTYDDDGNFKAYEMPDCSEAIFPFNDTFDVVVPEGSVDEGIAPFTLPDAAVIGPDFDLTGLGSEDQILTSTLSQQADFPMAWAYAGDINTSVNLNHQMTITLRNNLKQGVGEFEAIMCLANPADGSLPTDFTIPQDKLAELTPNPEPNGPYVVGLQLDSHTDGPDLTLPWGQQIRMMSTISIDGVGELLP